MLLYGRTLQLPPLVPMQGHGGARAWERSGVHRVQPAAGEVHAPSLPVRENHRPAPLSPVCVASMAMSMCHANAGLQAPVVT
jgi:hypothetical protein